MSSGTIRFLVAQALLIAAACTVSPWFLAGAGAWLLFDAFTSPR